MALKSSLEPLSSGPAYFTSFCPRPQAWQPLVGRASLRSVGRTGRHGQGHKSETSSLGPDWTFEKEEMLKVVLLSVAARLGAQRPAGGKLLPPPGRCPECTGKAAQQGGPAANPQQPACVPGSALMTAPSGYAQALLSAPPGWHLCDLPGLDKGPVLSSLSFPICELRTALICLTGGY